jgi:hypothetical protein
MQNFKKYTWRAAFLLVLGLGSAACEKAVEVSPYNSLNASTGYQTPQDVNAGLLGAYSTLQSANYYGLRYPLFADLQADNARWTGTFPTFNQVAINSILTDNVELTNIWNVIYGGINSCNYIIQQADLITDATFNKNNALAEARALRAFHYMNLLAWWGGTPDGYGYANGLGVPLRLTPTTNITDGAINPIARSSEADVNTVIRNDLTFAAANLAAVTPSGSSKARLSQAAVLALRARFELRQRDYTAAATYATQALSAAAGTGTSATNVLESQYGTIFSQKFSQETLWELTFDPVNSNSLAFFWYPSARGGRGEVAVATTLAAAHTANDTRRPVNVVAANEANATYATNTTRKYFRITTQDDDVQMVRLGEVVLTLAEAQARLGNLADATTQLNRIRVRAGLANYTLTPTTADPTGQNGLITQILSDRRLELANEGLRWFDLRRTNTVQSTLTTTTQTFRNLWPIPQREVLNSVPVGQTVSLVVQNPGY